MNSLETYCNLIVDQFTYGAQKYGANLKDRESTDILFEQYGKNWLLGTMDKYTHRYNNIAKLHKKGRERDVLKISTYAYLLWLKRGFQIQELGIDSPPIDTNIKNKTEEFSKFREKAIQLFNLSNTFRNRHQITNPLNLISSELVNMSRIEWKEIPEESLVAIFCLGFVEWERNFTDVAGQDADTYNEDNKEKQASRA